MAHHRKFLAICIREHLLKQRIVRLALERRPETAFDLVAVADSLGPSEAPAVTDHARSVLRSLSEMGLPPERLSLSAASFPGITGSEVHLYVR